MLSDTLSKGLERYRIGPKLRTLRLKRKMGLVELASHTGLSPAMLSKVERGRLFPTLPTLLRIALVFSVGLEHFFVEAGEAPVVAVVRRKDRLRFPDRPNDPTPTYHFESLDFPASNRPISAYYVEFAPKPDRDRAHDHAGIELIYVIEGKLAVSFGDDEEHTLGGGDAIYFDATRRHGYRRVGAKRCTAVVITAG